MLGKSPHLIAIQSVDALPMEVKQEIMRWHEADRPWQELKEYLRNKNYTTHRGKIDQWIKRQKTQGNGLLDYDAAASFANNDLEAKSWGLLACKINLLIEKLHGRPSELGQVKGLAQSLLQLSKVMMDKDKLEIQRAKLQLEQERHYNQKAVFIAKARDELVAEVRTRIIGSPELVAQLVNAIDDAADRVQELNNANASKRFLG